MSAKQQTFKLHPAQAQVFNDKTRFRVMAAGRRLGKSFLSIAEIIRAASAKPKQKVWYVAPTYAMCRSIIWHELIDRIPRKWIKNVNETRLEISLINGSVITLKGSDSPDCYDDQTEILTDSGWKFFKDLDRTESVLTLNQHTLKAEYKKPIRYVDEHYEGTMFRVLNNKLDLLVTPEHRFLIKSMKGVYKFKTLRDVSQHDAIPASVGWDGIDDDGITEDRCALMGFFLADGSAYGSMGGDIKKRKGNYEVIFCKKDEVKGGTKGNVRRQFAEVLCRLGYNYRETKIGLHVLNKALWSELREVGNRYDKFIPDRYKNLPPEKLRVLLHWMIMGDGFMRESGERVYYTTSKRLADDVQEIAIKSGFSASIRIKVQSGMNMSKINGRSLISTRPLYQVSIYTNKYNYLRNTKDGSYISETNYSGRVYCVEVENHVVMVRRNGRICWSGNSLRGVGLDFLVMDEVQDIPLDVWKMILRPTLAVSGGRALFIGTPKQFQGLYELFMMGQDRTKNPDWKSWQFVTADSPFVSDEELEAARRDMDPGQFDQEFRAQFINMSGRVYLFDRAKHIKSCPFNPELPIWVGQDFNINPMSSAIMQPQPNGELWVVDEIVRHNSNTQDTCDTLEAKYWRYMDQVVIYPDPSGGNRQHARGESNFDIFRQKGFRNIKAFRKAPAVTDRVNAVNRMLVSASNETRLYFDPKCVRTISSFEQTIYKPNSTDVDKAGGVEHSTECVGYIIAYEFPVRRIALTGISM